MNPIKAIIIDDESAARDVLSNLIARSSAPIEIVGTGHDLLSGIDLIKQHSPDVIFLDVQMPNYAGYEIADLVDPIDFEIIFVTAYDQYAIKAFELSAVDYLVKPISRQRLNESLQKLHVRIEEKAAKTNYQLLLDTIRGKELGKLVISELGGKRVIQLKDLIAIEAKGAYSHLIMKDQKPILVSKNLSHFESVLPDCDTFFRSHKSWIVNLDHLNKLNKSKGELVLSDDITARISKYRFTDFQDAISKLNMSF